MHSRAFQLVLLRAKEVLSASFRPRGARSGPRSGSLARKNESFFLAGWRKRGSEERRHCRKQSSEQSEKKASEGKFHAGRKQLLPALPLPLPSPSRPARAARSWLRTRGTCLPVCGKERASEREGSARGREEERRGRRRESGGVKQKQKNTFFVACFARLLLHSNASHLRPTPPTPLARALSLRFVQFGVLMCFFAFQVCVIGMCNRRVSFPLLYLSRSPPSRGGCGPASTSAPSSSLAVVPRREHRRRRPRPPSPRPRR
jgi:hypothetical protein